MKYKYMSLSIQQISPNKLKFPVVFNSLFGYNVMFRIGVIYNLTSKSNYIFIMRTYRDLVDLSYWFKLFTKKSRNYMKIKKLLLSINNPIFRGDFSLYRKSGIVQINDNNVIYCNKNYI